jgi:hypothetical protein
MKRSHAWIALLLLLLGCGTACRDQTESAPPPPRPSTPAPARALGTVPEGWLPGPAVGARHASHQVIGADGAVADISLVVMQPDPGWLTGSVNAWRQQLGLLPLSAEALHRSAQRLSTPAGTTLLFDLQGEVDDSVALFDGRLIAGVVERADHVWVFRIRGNPGLVGQHRQSFLGWIASVLPHEVEPDRPSPTAITANAGKAPRTDFHDASAPAEMRWRAPSDWEASADQAGTLAHFTINTGEHGKAVVSIWGRSGIDSPSREQLRQWHIEAGVAPVPGHALSSTPGTMWLHTHRSFQFLDIETDTSRTLAAWTQGPQALWFFKLEGPPRAVQAAAPAFASLLHSTEFSDSLPGAP